MKTRTLASWLPVLAVGTAALLPGRLSSAQAEPASTQALFVERGRYLVKIAGCNDCHTPGYLMNEGRISEALWLTGDSFGWSGPWGTTYASNLRILLSGLTEDGWVQYARSLRTRPPMPWFNLNEMEEADLRAIYRFVRSLGSAGEPAPAYLPPGAKPAGPHALIQ